MLKVQVISRETIQPSYPTPPHLSTFHLSFIDQMLVANPIYFPVILFYSGGDGRGSIKTMEKLQKLKISLAKTLTQFYPLAGRIKDNCSVHCNDEGVEFSEARVNDQLMDFLRQPYVEVLTQMVPTTLTKSKSGRDVILSVQVNIFDCGGMAVGIGIAHAVADGTVLETFLNGWASTTRGSSQVVCPTFESASLFPPVAGPVPVPANMFPSKANVLTKMFVFNASKISTLRSKSDAKPTRYEAVTSLIWRCVLRSMGEVGPKKVVSALHALDLRRRMAPPLARSSFGNIFKFCAILYVKGELPSQSRAEKELRDEIRKVDSDHILQMHGPDGHLKAYESVNTLFQKNPDRSVDIYYFSSWCGFSFYEVDFGWGGPDWVSFSSLPFESVILISTRSGDGIEAWVTMKDEDLAKLMKDEEFLSFTSPHIV